MTSMTMSLGAARLRLALGRTGRAATGPAALPENLHALDLARRLRAIVGAEQPPRLRLVAGQGA